MKLCELKLGEMELSHKKDNSLVNHIKIEHLVLKFFLLSSKSLLRKVDKKNLE